MENKNHSLDPDLEKQHQAWGTWEELLLACAVNRHGFKDWDTVAMEVQSRTNRPNLLATAHNCEQKFHDLNRRFTDQCNDVVSPPRQNGASVGVNSDHVPWLEELRKLRVAELRREVQRHDVKRLEEEKAKENDGKDDEPPDLGVRCEQRPENDKTGGELEEAGPANSEQEIRRLDESTTNTDKLPPTTGDESDRENQSVNESNSTGSRFEVAKTGEGNAKLGLGPPPVQAGPKEPDSVGRKKKSVGEESNNGSYDTEAKVPTCESVPPSEERKVDEDSSELHDSVAHSGEGGTRESSEVQSSASLTRKRQTRRRKEVSSADGGGELAPENDDVMKSEPLAGILDMIKGHENISLLRHLEIQQYSDRYKDVVRQHVDLETIQLRLQKGYYSSCTSSFFRDLLLLFTNATPWPNTIRSYPQKNDSLPPNAPLANPDSSLLSKHKASAPILVCRKRSSISAKPSSATFGQKGDQQPVINDKKERLPSDAKPPLKPSSSETDEDEPPKAKEKPVTGARSLRRSNKNLNSNPGKQKKMVSSGKGDKGKERPSRHNGGGGSGDKRNKNIENNSQSKRSVGRPPKKAAETNTVSAKRGRESSASAGKDKRPKKRSKK
ncbi:SANT/Myb domain [Sesbania bispinosa]|nr:SANT/Myb domain [Sesbania bispinosa]